MNAPLPAFATPGLDPAAIAAAAAGAAAILAAQATAAANEHRRIRAALNTALGNRPPQPGDAAGDENDTLLTTRIAHVAELVTEIEATSLALAAPADALVAELKRAVASLSAARTEATRDLDTAAAAGREWLGIALAALVSDRNAARPRDAPPQTGITVHAADGIAVTLATTTRTVISDPTLVPPAFLVPDPRKIEAAIKAGKAVPGTATQIATNLRLRNGK